MLNKLKTYFKGITKNTIFLAFSSLFADISTEMLYPLFPLFLSQYLQATGTVIGIIDGFAQATQSVLQGISGWLSDKLRKYKMIALLGYMLAAIGKPLMGLATGWPMALASRLLDRFGTGIRSAPRDALVASSVEKPYRGKAFGLEGFGDNLGAFLGPLVTLLLLVIAGLSIRTIFYCTLIPGLLAFLMVTLVTQSEERSPIKSKLDSRFTELPKKYWHYLLIVGIFSLGNSSNAFLILQTKQQGYSLNATILIYAFFNLSAALISYPAGYLSDLIGRKMLLMSGFIIFFLTYGGFALSYDTSFLPVFFILYGLFQGIFRAIGKAFAIDLSPPHLHATGVGWFMAITGILQLVASCVAGLLWDHISHVAVFIYGCGFAFAGIIALSLF